MYTTTNLGLKKPEGVEFYDVQHMNDNMNVLDASIAEIQKSNDASIATMEKHINDTENPHEVTKEHVGLGEVPNVSTNDQAPTYTEASTLATLTSGEKLSVAFGKIKCAITRLIAHIADTTLHITANERATWNAKASTDVVSTSENGLCPKRSGTTTKFLRDDGTWAVPPDTNTTYGTANTSTAGLMTAAMVTKLNGIETGATKNTVDSALSTTSTNPVQNKVVSAAIEEINSNLNKLFNGVPNGSSQNISTNTEYTIEQNCMVLFTMNFSSVSGYAQIGFYNTSGASMGTHQINAPAEATNTVHYERYMLKGQKFKVTTASNTSTLKYLIVC